MGGGLGGCCASSWGQFVGSVAPPSRLTFVQSDLGLAMVSAGVIFAILIIALFAMGSGSANTGWGFVKPMEEAGAASDFEKAGTRLARRCRLSPREIEVFFLLAKGRNPPTSARSWSSATRR